MRRRVSEVLVLALLVLIVGACDDSTTPTTPTPTPVVVTETFSGILRVNGAQSFPFASDAGSVNATLTALGPDSATVIGMAVGTWSGVTCQVILANDRATVNSLVTGAVSTQGTLCLRVFDSTGELTEPVNFTVEVEHF